MLRTKSCEHRSAPDPKSRTRSAPGSHPAGQQALLGVEVCCRKRDSAFQRAGMPGGAAASFLPPTARFLPQPRPYWKPPALPSTAASISRWHRAAARPGLAVLLPLWPVLLREQGLSSFWKDGEASGQCWLSRGLVPPGFGLPEQH